MGFAVLAFPCNQFGGQEPGEEPNIKEIVRNEHVRSSSYYLCVCDVKVMSLWRM